MLQAPVTRYADCEGVSIAYQVLGTGDRDLVFVPGGVSHVDVTWQQDRHYRRMMERLASFARVTVFDKRGMGASDPVLKPPTLEERTADIRAVMDAVGIEQAAIFGLSEGGTSAIRFAATFPERVRALVLCGTFPAGGGVAPDPGYPTDAMRAFWEKLIEPWKARMGQGVMIEMFAPDLATHESSVAAMAAFERSATTPKMWRAMLDGLHDLDVRPFLGRIAAPTLLLHRRQDLIPIEGARYMASRIRGARLVELEGNAHIPWVGDMDALLDEVQEFLTGARPARGERRLATVLFTDIVGSTERASALGDRRWRVLLEDHYEAVRQVVERLGGRLVKTIGDGTLAVFDAPTPAIASAREVVLDAERLGLAVRAGIHTGECEVMGDDVSGIAVHVGARIAAVAGPGEVLVSSTVKDLVAGSAIAFADRGVHELKGLPSDWRLYRLG